MIKRIHLLICMLLASMSSMATTHEYVDLGLPSGTLWATCNVGATSKEQYGTYYAWGETSPKSKYSWSNYQHANGSYKTCQDIGVNISDTQYDAAKIEWGDNWRMPTKDEINELVTQCTWTAATVNSVKGYTVKGPSGNTIFLPFAGCSYDGTTYGKGSYTYYWSSEVSGTATSSTVNVLYLKSGSQTKITTIQRRTGAVIRPVKNIETIVPPTSDETLSIELVDLGLSVKWTNMNLGGDSPQSMGAYYSWGETSPKSKYAWSNYKYANGTKTTVQDIGSNISATEYDAAFKYDELDGICLPTTEQWEELITKCTWTATIVEGVNGFTVTGPSSKSIFLPLAGWSYEGNNYSINSGAYYWSANNDASAAYKAQVIKLTTSDQSMTSIQRRTGIAIRAVEYKEDPAVEPPTETMALVDLGLSIKWTNMNLGGESPQSMGAYYSWGETSPKSKYAWSNYKYANGTKTTVQDIGSNISATEYDAAFKYDELDGICLPTTEQWEELITKCTWTATIVEGVNGFTVTGPSSKSIFLPLAGWSYEGNNYSINSGAYYWSANNDASAAYKAQVIKLTTSDQSMTSIQRRTGIAIRAVEYKEEPTVEPPTTPEAYALLSIDKTMLTFYYDTRKTSRPGTKYEIATNSTQPGWTTVSTVKSVVFDSSFADAKPTSCASWFNFSGNSLKTITDIKYLDTSEVTDMSYMFNGCTQLETLDLSTFNTSKVETMRSMFASCSKLMVLNLLWLDASNVRDMSEMFSNCSNLIYLYPPINTSKVTDMHAMFKNCQKLTALQFSAYFDTNHVTNMSELFNNCRMLSELDLTSFNFRSVTSSSSMFYGSGLKNIWVNATVELLPNDVFNGVGNSSSYKDCPTISYPPGVSLSITDWNNNQDMPIKYYKGGYFSENSNGPSRHLLYDVLEGTSFVDLGLPSGNLWSEYNVGSIHEWTAGSYFAWSEKDIKKTYYWDNYKKTISSLKTYNFEYCNRERDPEYGTFIDNLDTDADIVNDNNKLFYVGIPTQAEFKELVDNCMMEDYELYENGWKMVRLTSKNNGKILYLPYSGCFFDSKTPLDSTATYYWTSSSVDSNKAYTAKLSDGQVTIAQCQKRTGMPLRAIARYSGTYVNGSNFDRFEVDGIRNVGTTIADDSPVYNLQGVKVEGALKPGVYIKNGRKFVVK